MSSSDGLPGGDGVVTSDCASGGGGGGRLGTRAEDLRALEAEMKSMGIVAHDVQTAPKRDPGTAEIARARLITNVHGVRLDKITVYRYDVEIFGFRADGKSYELSKPSRKDYTSVQRRRVCQSIFTTQPMTNFFKGLRKVYDGQKILITAEKLKIDGRSVLLTVDPTKEEKIELDAIARIEVKISEASERPEVRLCDLANSDRMVAQYVDIATSQFAVEHPDLHVVYGKGTSYLMKPWEEGFDKHDCPNLSEGKYVSVGAHKGASCVEGPKGRGANCVALVIDTAKTAFHAELSVLEKAFAVIPRMREGSYTQADRLALRKQLKGLFVRSEVKREDGTFATSTFEISDVSSLTADTCQFQVDGKDVSVTEYYFGKYALRLRNAHLPLLETRRGATKLFFPMEICKVVDFQRVSFSQQTSAQIREMRDACIVEPIKRLQQNMKNAQALSLWGEKGEWLKKLGLNVIDHGLEVESRILPPPMIKYGGSSGQVAVDPVKMWQPGKQFLRPAAVDVWAMYGIVERDRFGLQELNKFALKFVERARMLGIRIGQPNDMKMLSPNPKELMDTVKNARDCNCEFIFFVQSDKLALHDVIKDAEREYQVVTQDMRISKAIEVTDRGRVQTLQNIINKTNIKLGGLNYEVLTIRGGVEHMKADRLYIGFALSHAPPSGMGPASHSVVGYSANWRHPSEFIGDFGFQEARRADNTHLVRAFMKEILERYKRNRKNGLKDVIIYRAGASDGELGMILRYEVPLIRHVIKEAGFVDAKVTLIVVNRLHHLRFIPANITRGMRPTEQNVRTGTVVDEKVVHALYCEFYLNSHKALQGTAKTPRYTVLLDESNFTMNDLEQMTYTLCFNHQIVNLSTSVPTPLYVANCYADRGRRLYNIRSNAMDGSSSSSDAGGDFSVVSMSVDEANAKLPYEKTPLSNIRINA